MNGLAALLDRLGRAVLENVEEMGKIFLLFISVLAWMFRPPLKLRNIFKQMEFVGVKSIFVVVLTGTFTGMVMALQGYHGFRMFSAESLVGGTVALGMTRELGPVLTSLMVTARAGSAMAAELGTMRVTEQIDALYVMAANPVKHLIVPRVIAGVLMVPLLTVVSDFVGILGGYFVGVHILDINSGVFIKNITRLVEFERYLQRPGQGRLFRPDPELHRLLQGIQHLRRRRGGRPGDDGGGGPGLDHDPDQRLFPDGDHVLSHSGARIAGFKRKRCP